jgi:uncharacterized membrane-anchored protein
MPTSNLNKVAPITIGFWAAKVIATTLGETAGDFISQTMGFGYVAGFLVTAALLGAILFAQVRRDDYAAGWFWAAIVGTTTAGTEISDLMDRTLGFGYVVGSSLLLAGLLATLALWYARRRDLSVDPILGKESEILFWTAVVFSNSLGTAFGDALVDPLGLTFAQGAVVCAGIVGVVLAAHRLTSINAALLFWAAFVFTRPFGATFGDVLTKGHEAGGLGLGTLETSVVATALLILVVSASSWFENGRRVLARDV